MKRNGVKRLKGDYLDPETKQMKNREERAGLVDVKRFDGITDAKKAALKSLQN